MDGLLKFSYLRQIKKKIAVLLSITMIMSMCPVAFGQTYIDDDTFVELSIQNEQGRVIADLKDSAQQDWKLVPGATYYLKAKVRRTDDINYVALRMSGLDDEKHMIPNGIKIESPPGGKYHEGSITDDAFDSLYKYTPIDDPTYGSNNSIYRLQDGEVVYHIKNSIKANTNFNFTISFIVDNTVYNNAAVLKDAIGISFLKEPTSKNETDKNFSLDLPVKGKNDLKVGISTSGTNVILDRPVDVGAILTGTDVALLYDEVKFDIVYPKNAEFKDVGFNLNHDKESPTYGKLEYTLEQQAENNVAHVSIHRGMKTSSSSPYYYYSLVFPKKAFKFGDKAEVTIENMMVYLPGNETPLVSSDTMKCQYTVIDPSKDATYMSAQNRTVYNLSAETSEGYLTQLGGAYIKNTSSEPTPADKIIEAVYNVNHAEAQISMITFPKGTSTAPKIEVTGETETGEEKTIVIESNFTEKSTKVNGVDCGYYIIWAKNYGLKNITKAKADIGALVGGYYSSSWTAFWTIENNQCGAFGQFTSPQAGIEVVNDYTIYNKELNSDGDRAGELSVEAVATSTLDNRASACQNSFSMTTINNGKTEDIISKPSVPAGNEVTIKAQERVVNLPGAICNTNDTDNGKGVMMPETITANRKYGTAMAIANPECYLFLPKGLSYKDLKFSLYKDNTFGGKKETVPLTASVQNISYVNKTGDGTSIFKVTFPEGTYVGYYDEEGRITHLNLEITLMTSKSMRTGSYEFNNLIQFTSRSGLTGCVYSSDKNIGNYNNISQDKYGVNNGQYLLGITNGATERSVSLQEIAEVQVENAITVTKINDQTVENPEWFTYDPSNANTIALLGRNSEGKIRLDITNMASAASKEVEIVMPIPKKGDNLGSLFMDQPSGFTMKVDLKNAQIPEGFDVKEVMITAQNGQGGFEYRPLEEGESGNAVLLSASELAGKSNVTAYLGYTIDDGASKELNIFRTAHTYKNGEDTNNRVGSFVAAQIATGYIHGNVYEDKNRNGEKDADEKGIEGINVIATDGVGKVQNVVTDENGDYKFLAVREDNVTLSFEVNSGNADTYRFNVPSSQITCAVNGLSASKTYSNIVGDTELNVPMGTYHVIHYDANGGSGTVPNDKECAVGDQVTIEKNPDTLKKTAYVFKEWNTQADGNGTTYDPGSSLEVQEENFSGKTLNLYAIWKEKNWTINLDCTGGSIQGLISSFKITDPNVSYAAAYKAQAGDQKLPMSASECEAEKTGYTFNGWTTQKGNTNKKINSNTKLDTEAQKKDSVTLYALWNPKTAFKVIYDTGENGSEIAAKENVAWNGTILPETEPVREGYTFLNWEYHKQDGTSVEITPQTTYNSLTQDDQVSSLTLTAKWEIKKFDIVLNSNDETFGSISGAGNYEYGKQLTVKAVPSEGYHFVKWVENEEEVSSEGEYSFTVTTNRTLAAQFEKDPDEIPGQGNEPGSGENPGQGNEPGSGENPGQGNEPGSGENPGQGNEPGNGENPDQGNEPGSGENPDQESQPGAAVNIEQQPESIQAEAGEEVQFEVRANGEAPITYQWFVNQQDGEGFKAIEGAVANSYTVAATLENDGFEYKCLVSNASGSVETQAASLRVKQKLTILTERLPDGVVGIEYRQTLAAAGEKPIYWQLVEGNLPDTFVLDPQGLLTGTATTAAAIRIVVKAENGTQSDIKEYCFNITEQQEQQPVKVYTVIFDSNGGESILPQNIEEGQIIDLITPTRSGYEFLGWYDGSHLYTGQMPVTKDTLLTARWRFIPIESEPSDSSSSESSSSEQTVVQEKTEAPAKEEPKNESKPTITADELVNKLSDEEKEALKQEVQNTLPYTLLDEELINDYSGEALNSYLSQQGMTQLNNPTELIEKIGFVVDDMTEYITLDPKESAFKDVPKTHWAFESIQEAEKLGLVKGMPNATFKPKEGLKVADTFTFLDRVLLLHDMTEMKQTRNTVEKYITDKDHWAFYSVASICSKLDESTIKTVSELNGQTLTRELLAQVIYEVTKDKFARTQSKDNFTDIEASSYQEAVQYCIESGVLVGVDKTHVAPKKTLTRAELMAILIRLNILLGEQE